ncbi:MAG: carbon-nitrogen hydrolase family protein [Burkholderiales bacterium]|nr:carbon-nitrogen hydrolase family protein [Burkholderiales bacterium]
MSRPASVRAGIVLPHSHYGEAEWRNAERAIAYADEAARQGAQLVLYPEGYPGPMTGPLDNPKFPFDPVEELKKKAKEHAIYIIAGNVVASDVAGAHLLTLRLFGPDGAQLARYVRQQPDTPPLNAYLYGGKGHLLPGRERMVVDTDLGRIGLLICSELWCPELPRMLMLRGAEIIVSPVHGRHSRTGLALQDTWYCIARARAAENLCYVLSTQNLYVSEDFDYRTQMSAGAIAAGPERMEGRRSEPGVLLVDLDMDRLRYLRTRNFDEENLSVPEDPDWRPIGCRPGQIYERDPALYRELAEPSPYSYDYRYWEEGSLDGWLREYDRIYQGDYRRILEHYGGPFQFKER